VLALAAAALVAGCGNDDKPAQDVVTALEDYTDVTPTALERAIEKVRDSAQENADDLAAASRDLRRDVDSGRLRGARQDYDLARPAYARMEALAALYPELDATIRERGFIPLARDLYREQRVNRGTRAAAAALDSAARELRARIPKLRIPPRTAVLNAAGTVDRIQRHGVTGELEPDSKLDLTVMLATLDGAETTFLAVEDFVKAKNRRLAGKVIDGFDDTNTDVLDLKRDGKLPEFTAVSDSARREIQKNLDDLEYAFSQVSGVLADGLR
jgi:iron uptake system component EfeO